MESKRDAVSKLFGTVNHLAVLQELATAVPYLSESEQLIVNYIIHHPREVAEMGAAELAEATGVSQATLFRLCRQLRFTGYSALRDQVKEAVHQLGERFIAPTQANSTEDRELDALELGAYVGIRELLDACAIPRSDLERAASAISQSTRVHICGMGPISGRLAEMTAFAFQQLGHTCMLWIDVQALNREYARFNSHDVVLALSHSGENKELAKFIASANDQSATTIAIVNYSRSVMAEQAQIPLITQSRESQVQNFDLLPRLPQLLVVQVLVNLVRKRVGHLQKHP